MVSFFLQFLAQFGKLCFRCGLIPNDSFIFFIPFRNGFFRRVFYMFLVEPGIRLSFGDGIKAAVSVAFLGNSVFKTRRRIASVAYQVVKRKLLAACAAK